MNIPAGPSDDLDAYTRTWTTPRFSVAEMVSFTGPPKPVIPPRPCPTTLEEVGCRARRLAAV